VEIIKKIKINYIPINATSLITNHIQEITCYPNISSTPKMRKLKGSNSNMGLKNEPHQL